MYEGTNTRGKYFLYVVRGPDGKEYSWFAPVEAHETIQTAALRPGSEFLVSRGTNGKRGGIELSILGKPEQSNGDPKNLMRQCLKDALEITREIEGVPWRSEDIQRISVAMYISRTRQNGNS